MSYYLAGDIGGTKTLLQVFEAGLERTPLLCKSYPSADYASLAEIVAVFLQEAAIHEIASACFALAGPVSARKAKLTNLPWEVDADFMAAQFHIAEVCLVNDFEAVGLGIAALESGDLLSLQQGESQAQGIRIVVGAGTGLGVAWLSWTENGYAVHPSEGGHIDFAPANELQYALLKYLQQRHGHVSYERIVSGPGLVAIFEFLRDSRYVSPSVELIAAMNEGDAAAAITHFATEQKEKIALQSLEIFTQIYGAFVGNIALTALPRGGIYVAGGIAAKIIAQMQQGGFIESFLDKGRFKGELAKLPLSIVMNAQIGLLGASRQAQNKRNFR
jgi:glucokinase